MSYKKAEKVLPADIIELIQQYVEGETIYIPRRTGMRREWGEKTAIRKELKRRNQEIYSDYLNGIKVCGLAEKYFLSEKSIQRIIREMKHQV